MKFEEYLDSLRNKVRGRHRHRRQQPAPDPAAAGAGHSRHRLRQKIPGGLGPLGDELEQHGCRLQLGEDYLKDLTEDVIFRTPGLRPDVPELAAAVARGSLLTSEMEVFLRSAPAPRSPSPGPTARPRPPRSSQSSWRPPGAPSTWGATSAARCCATRRTSRQRIWRCWSSAPSS